MPQKKRAKKKIIREYSPESLMMRSVTGIVMIALGVLALLSMVAGLRGAAFDFIRGTVQGLGGIFGLGIPAFLIWGGILLAFSARRSMPIRGLFLVLIIYFCILGIVNLMSKVGVFSFIEYVVAHNQKQVPPAVDPQSFWNVVKGSFQICQSFNSFGGALGMIPAWILWLYMGSIPGTAVLSIVCLLCLMMLANFDLITWWKESRRHYKEKAETKERNKEKQDTELLAKRQEDERTLLPIPAYRRRGKKAEPLLEENSELVGQSFADVPIQAEGIPPGFPMNIPFPFVPSVTAHQPSSLSEERAVPLYDEIVMTPNNEKPAWMRSFGKKRDKSTNAIKTAVDQDKRKSPLDRESQKILERMEEISRRKAELAKELYPGMTSASSYQAPGSEAVPQSVQPNATPKKQQNFAAKPSMTPSETDTAKNVAYMRPLSVNNGTDAQPIMSGQRLDSPNLKLPDKQKKQEVQGQEQISYSYPTLDLLRVNTNKPSDTRAADTENALRLEKTLESFNIPAKVQRVTHGPTITRFELGLVSSGVNVKRIMGISDNIALELAANGGVRIEIPIPGTNLFGIEVPNRELMSVSFSEVLVSPEMSGASSSLSVALGRDIAGKPIICDLEKMPHLLIAGQTGGGKSVCINTIINSILFRASPEDVRMIMIDPKVVELQGYNVVPHLLVPVVSDPHKAAGALAWAVSEMLDRYHKMKNKNVRKLSAYNAKIGPGEEKLPRIVIIIDELSDLMLACKKDVEESIIRLAQLARAAGIHMVIATQRPTVDVITGLIKANIPSRIAFAVTSSTDSRTILDMNGAEKLLGNGDMLYFPTGASVPLRVQGCFLSDEEIERVMNYITGHSQVEFDPNIIEALESTDENVSGMEDVSAGGVDEKLHEAIEMVIADGQASISMLQRRMKIGYARAGRLIDDMAARGIVSKASGSKPREVLISREEYEKMKDSLLA